MFDDEDVLELLWNGFGVCDIFYVIFELFLSWDVVIVIFLDIVLEEVEFGSEIVEYENDNEVGMYEVIGLCN